MRYLWVDAGNDPNFDLGDQHGIDGYFMPLFGERTTRDTLRQIREGGHAAGVYVGHGWFPLLTAAQYATQVYAEYERVLVQGLRLQVNLEQHDPVYIIDVLERLRAKRSNLPLSWTLEGMQGGWAAQIATDVVAARVRVVPQAYTGSMERMAEDAVLRDLLRAGYPESSVSLFYDAAALARGWQGYAFTQGRLP